MKKLDQIKSNSTIRVLMTVAGLSLISGYATESRAQVAETLTFFADCNDKAKIRAEGARLLGIKKGAEAPKFEVAEGEKKCLEGGLVQVPIRPKTGKAETQAQPQEMLIFFADCKDVAKIRAEGARLLGIKKGAEAPKFEVATGEAECLAGGLVKVPIRPKADYRIIESATKDLNGEINGFAIFETEKPEKRNEFARLVIIEKIAKIRGSKSIMENDYPTLADLERVYTIKMEPMFGSKPPVQIYKVTWLHKDSGSGRRDSVGITATIELEPLPELRPTKKKGRGVVELESPSRAILPGQVTGMADPDGLPMSGDFTDEQVDKYIELRQKAFQYCYPKNEGVTGEITFKFTFGKDGKIGKVTTPRNSLKDGSGNKQDKRFIECAISAIKRMNLPPQSRKITRTMDFGF